VLSIYRALPIGKAKTLKRAMAPPPRESEEDAAIAELPRGMEAALLVTGGYDHTIRIWNPDTCSCKRTLQVSTASIVTISSSASHSQPASRVVCVTDEMGPWLILSSCPHPITLRALVGFSFRLDTYVRVTARRKG
jgi:hypothetical protein